MNTIRWMTTFVLLATAPIFAQEQIPDAVTRLIGDDTVAVAHVSLKLLDLDQVGPALRTGLDVTSSVSGIAQTLDQILLQLKSIQVSDVYVLQGTSDLPVDGVLVVPTTNTKAIAEAMRTILPNDVEEIPGAVVVGSQASRQRVQVAKPTPRPEFAAALKSLDGMTIQLSMAPSVDARRVLRESVPNFPAELGGGATANIIDGTKWLAVGGHLSPNAEFRLIGQAANATAAQTMQQLMARLFQMPRVKEIIPKSDELQTLLTPKQQDDRIVLTLTEANGGVKRLLDEVATPLMAMARTNALQRQTVGHLKMFGLAMHNYYDKFKSFPTAAFVSKDGGQKLLSWRVHVLPFLDAGPLYKEFHLDESWDSDHNKKLIEKMPEIFQSSNISAEQRRLGMTTYLVPVGEKTVFEKPAGTTFNEIKDGMSNTIMIVDALCERATIWTRPDDLPFDPKDPWKGLGVPKKQFFWTTFCDGSVRRIQDITEANLRRYFQMNDGEVIDQ